MGERVRHRILIADGEPSARRLLARALSDRGRAVEVAEDGPGALAALARWPFAIAIVDLDLVGTSGKELATVILERWPETALIVSSAAADTTAAVAWMQAGAYDYLTKPFDLAQVLTRLDAALGRRRTTLEARQQRRQLEVGVLNQTRVTKRLFLGAIKSLSSALEAKDQYTKGHSERVCRVAAEIARAVGVGRDEIRRIRLAGRLHDIGKIGVREEVLSKPSALTEAEYKHVQTHPLVGERILAPTLIDAETVRMVRHHHERYSGGGYPDGLVGSKIPFGARVLAVADAFDALNSDRPYRARLGLEEALKVLREGEGEQWQPTLVEALVQRAAAGRPFPTGH